MEPFKNQFISNKQINLIDYKEIKIEKQIGKGGQGIIELGNWNGIKVAIKHISQQKMNDQQQISEYLNEISIMQNINHPQIIRFFWNLFWKK